MSGLFASAKEAQFVNSNLAAGVKYPGKKSRDGLPVWTEDEVAAYEARWPLGTRERVWLAIVLYTGLRSDDAARLGRQHVSNGIATIRTELSLFALKRAKAASRWLFHCCRRYLNPCGQVRPATLRSSAAPTAGRSPKSRSATSSEMPVTLLACGNLVMGLENRSNPRSEQWGGGG